MAYDKLTRRTLARIKKADEVVASVTVSGRTYGGRLTKAEAARLVKLARGGVSGVPVDSHEFDGRGGALTVYIGDGDGPKPALDVRADHKRRGGKK